MANDGEGVQIKLSQSCELPKNIRDFVQEEQAEKKRIELENILTRDDLPQNVKEEALLQLRMINLRKEQEKVRDKVLHNYLTH